MSTYTDPEDNNERDRNQLKPEYDSTPGGFAEMGASLKRHLDRLEKQAEVEDDE